MQVRSVAGTPLIGQSVSLTDGNNFYLWWDENDAEEAGTIRGYGGNDHIEGDAGSDEIYGDSSPFVGSVDGNDFLIGGDWHNDTETALPGDWGDDDFFGDGGDDRLLGGGGEDDMFGGTGNDILIGGGGDDWMEGGAGFDDHRGGAGNDTVWYDREGSVTVDLASFIANAGAAFGDTFRDIENIAGSNFGDALYGNQFVNVLSGLDGHDTLHGRGDNDALHGGRGDDVLLGGLGADALFGGEGSDWANYSDAPSMVVADLLFPSIQPQAGYAAGDTFDAIENLFGSNSGDHLGGNDVANNIQGVHGGDLIRGRGGNDWLYGMEGDDVIAGDGGADTIDGGNGADWAVYDGAPTGVTVNFLNIGANTGEAAGDLYNLIENLQGSLHGDNLRGNNNANTISGLNGVDLIYGEGGNDILYGDIGADTLDGGAGADTMFGGTGDDTFWVDNTGDAAVEDSTGGAGDWVRTLLTTYTLGANVENLDYANSGGIFLSFAGTGNGSANIIQGFGGNDVLRGLGGVDTLRGYAGDDMLDGGADADTTTFSAARANYHVHTKKSGGAVTTMVQDEVGSEGADMLTAIETLRFSNGDVTRFGAQQNLTANVDGQRFDDVVYRKVSNGQVVFQNMTNGVGTGFDAITSPLTSAWRAIGTGDVTGDGKADVFVWNSSTGEVFSAAPGASGAATFAVVATGISGNFAAMGVGDLDGDGFSDLLVRDGSNGAVSWRPMTDGSGDAFKAVGTFGTSWTYQGTGDVNRDGLADVAIRSAAGQVLFVNMANTTNFIDLGNVSGFRVGAIADLNGDGFDDVAFQNEANGQVVWRNLSGVGAAWNVATDPLGMNYVLRRGADVDNDGSADLIFQHATTGETIYRAMDNGVATGWGTVSNALGGDFLVV